MLATIVVHPKFGAMSEFNSLPRPRPALWHVWTWSIRCTPLNSKNALQCLVRAASRCLCTSKSISIVLVSNIEISFIYNYSFYSFLVASQADFMRQKEKAALPLIPSHSIRTSANKSRETEETERGNGDASLLERNGDASLFKRETGTLPFLRKIMDAPSPPEL